MKTMRSILDFLVVAFLCMVFLAPIAAYAQSGTCVNLSGDLTFGDTGSDVTTLQTFLKGQGYLTAPLVPNFGNATLAAVRTFQGAQGISATGTVGPLTRAAIQRVSCQPGQGGSTPPSPQSTIPTNTSSNKFEVTGWIPYWRAATGSADVMPHLDELSEINPFVYSVKTDGTLVDNAGLDTEPWTSLFTAARAKKVRVIPTVMWSNADAMHAILSDAPLRQALETRIANLAKQNGFDGVDIDFEGKHADDKNNFSTFLKGLYQRMGNKWVTCDIEARTPVDARYYGTEVPPDATVYANDFTAINKYCDRVKVMAYDQQGIDLQLSAEAASSSQIYAPVADPLWVIKVINLMSKSIAKSKILIGVPTYGYEYDVTAYAGNEYNYDILWTFNPGYAWPVAQLYGITPVRNIAGEMQFTYLPAGTATGTPPVSINDIPSALLAAAASSAYADSINSHQSFRLMDWPDAQSIAGKAELAANLGVRGIAIFKLDGGEDPTMWRALLGVKQ